MKVTRYNQSIRVIPSNDKEKKVVDDFLKKQYTFTRVKEKGKTKFKEVDRFFYYILHKNEYVIIDSLMKEFFYHIFTNGISKTDVTVSLRETKTKDVGFSMRVNYTPRDEQPFFIEGMVDEKGHHRVIVEAETGYGKTYMASEALSVLNKGVMIYILPNYIDKWIEDVTTYLNVDEEEIYIIQGNDSLLEFMESDKDYKVVIASMSTMRVYFENTSNTAMKNDLYPLQPDELMEKKNLGILLSDETHQSFNNIYTAIMLLDPKKVIALSATLITKDYYLEKFHKQLFPKESRLALKAFKKFLIVENVSYHVNTAKKLNLSYGYGYSHKRWEKFILRNRRLKKDYMDMIIYHIDKHYTKRKRDGDKCLVYASSLEMIKFITEELKKHYKNFDVREYIGGSNYANALEPDIRVSHQQSLGAAIDIKNLIYTLNTINMDSISTLLQMKGRLRENDIPVIFTQLICTIIPQHKRYVTGNKKYIIPRIKQMIETTYPKTLHT